MSKDFINRIIPAKWFRFLILSFWGGLVAGFLLLLLLIWFVSINLFGLFGGYPPLEVLENPDSELASELYSEDGEILGKYYRTNRTQVEFEHISQNVKDALVSTEDARFYGHSGVDFEATMRVIAYILIGKRKGGGSTLSQQLAKNLFDTRGEKYKGPLSSNMLVVKIKEWKTAIKIERAYTKKEIMTMYLNAVFFSHNTAGIREASKTFFNKYPSKLNIQEAAVLVGMLKAPSSYSPVRHYDESLKRRNVVMAQMMRAEVITRAQFDSLKALPIELQFKISDHNSGLATHFRNIVRGDILKWCREHNYDLFADGLKIYTTIDSRLQQYAEDAVNNHMKGLQATFDKDWGKKEPWVDAEGKTIKNYILNKLRRTSRYRQLKKKYSSQDSINYYIKKPVKMTVFTHEGEVDTLMSPYDSVKHYARILQTGLLSVNPRNGHIKAWVGGLNHKYFKFDHVKQARRQPGSTFKPFVYAAALDYGYNPCSPEFDLPVQFEIQNGSEIKTWAPENFSHTFRGDTLSLRQALAFSKNSVAARVAKKVGIDNVIRYAHKIGIHSELDTVPSICLGTGDVTLYEMVGAYGTFLNEGVWTKPYYISKIEDKNGEVIAEFLPEKKEAINKELAYKMIYMLRGGTEETKKYSDGKTSYGTSISLNWRYDDFMKNDNQVGGKTGTTQNGSDGWYMGITKDLVTGIWVGNDDRKIHFKSGYHGQGSKMALPIFAKYMSKAYKDPKSGITQGPFEIPADSLLPFETNCKEAIERIYANQQTGIDDI